MLTPPNPAPPHAPHPLKEALVQFVSTTASADYIINVLRACVALKTCGISAHMYVRQIYDDLQQAEPFYGHAPSNH